MYGLWGQRAISVVAELLVLFVEVNLSDSLADYVVD